MKVNGLELDEFTVSYCEAALWSTVNCVTPGLDKGKGEHLDARYSINDIPASVLKTMVADCEAFQRDNELTLSLVGDDQQHGHDFWLTREGHGAGFWSRGYGDIGETLSERAREYGNGSDDFGAADWAK